VTRNYLKWVKGFLRFTVETWAIQGIPPPQRADDFLYLLRNGLAEVECYLRDADRQAMRDLWDEAGVSRGLPAAFWTRRRADAARLRRVLRDPALPRLLERWEERRVFTDR
jgi:hypothetical protein